jgi:hypothetical protein
MIEELTPKKFAYLRLRDDLSKFILAHPELSIRLYDPSVQEAEARVMDAIEEYENGAPLLVVSEAFQQWKHIQIEQSKPQTLFK